MRQKRFVRVMPTAGNRARSTALAVERQRFEDLIDAQPAGIYRLRVRRAEATIGSECERVDLPQYQIEFVSKRFCEIAGLSKSDFQAQPNLIMERLVPEDRQDFSERNAEALSRVIPFQWEGRLVSSGEPQWVRFESLPRSVEEGGTLWTGVLTDITERRKAEEDLRRTHDLLRQAEAVAKIGSWEIDVQSGALFWSDETYKIFELSPASYQPTVESSLQFYTPDWRPIITRAMQCCIETGQGFDLDLELVTAKGHRSWVHGSGRAILRDGWVIKVMGAVQDVSKERLEAEELARNNAVLASILESSGFPIFSVDLDYRYTSFNQAHAKVMKALYGCEISMGSSLLERQSVPTDRARAKNNLAQAMGGVTFVEEALSGEEELNRRHFEVTHAPIRNLAGQIIGAAVFARDITQQSLESEALRASENRYRALVNAIPDLIFTNSRDGEYLDAQASDPSQLLVPRERFLHRKVTEVLPGPVADQYLHAYAQALDLGKCQELEYELDIAGVRQDFEARVVPQSRDTVVSLVRNITLRKQMEQQILDMSKHLEQRVHQRTRDLEAANQELEAFAYSVSHDLRAPLRAIAGFTTALARDGDSHLSQTGQDHLRRIQWGADRMTQLIEDLLRLSRIGQDDCLAMPVDLGEVAEKILAGLQATDPARQVHCQVQRPIPVIGDIRLLRVLLENLLGNAWKFSAPVPGACITVAARALGQTKVEVTITDNGVGFPSSQVGKLFAPFHRLHKPDEFPGNGIGLAIANRIVHRHGGSIRAEGSPMKGAAFSFSLPTVPEGKA